MSFDPLIAAAAVVLAVAVWVVLGGRASRRRMDRLVESVHADRGAGASAARARSDDDEAGGGPPARAAILSSRTGRRGAAVIAGAALAVAVGGAAGLLIGVVVGAVVERVLARAEPALVRQRRDRLVADLPAAADLLSACLRAGRSIETSVDVVADAIRGPLGTELTAVARALRLGADTATAWSAFRREPVLAPFGRAITRAAESGAPLARTLDRIAADARRARHGNARERARAVGVKAAAPLGLCFLPAFLLIGIVPVVVSAFLGLLA